MKVKFVHNEDGDWCGLYIDGKLVLENHSLSPEEVLRKLGIPFEIACVEVENRLPFFLAELINEAK